MSNLDSKGNINILIFKPSKYLYLFSLFSFIIWILLGPISWRHIDDFGPMYEFIKTYIVKSDFVFPRDLSDINILSTFISSLSDRYGWGTYPHLWSIIYLPISLSFIKYGIDVTRYITITIGFISCLLITILLSNLISLCVINKINNKDINFEKIRFLSDFFSSLVVLFCPQIMLHSITYMPYQIPAITTLIFLNALICFKTNFCIKENNKSISNTDYLSIPFTYSIIIIWFSILLSWQSIFLIIALILYLGRFLHIKNIKVSIIKYFEKVKYLKSNLKNISLNIHNFTVIFLVINLLYLTRIYLIKLINLNKLGHLNGIPFAWGFGNEYNINLFNSNVTHIKISQLIPNLLFVLARIFSLAMYPFRIYQNFSAIIILIIFTISFLFYFKYSKLTKEVSLFILVAFLVPIIFAIFGKFIIAPSRHAIYLFPLVWLPIGSYFVSKNSIKYSNQGNRILKSAQLIVILIFLNGLISSHNAINYSNYQKEKVYELAKKADYFPLGSFMGQYDFASLFWTHGSKEWDLIKKKECWIDKNDLNGKLIFLYSHREPFINDENHKNNLANAEYFPSKYACIQNDLDLEIIDSIKFKRITDIEVDNLIENGGSNAYGYLLKVSTK